jgi:hypothetical protein
MMTQQQIFKEIALLSISEQLEIVDAVKRKSLRLKKNNSSEPDEFQRKLSVEERIAIAKNLSGCLKPDAGYVPMTKEEEREIIEEYLAEKYA